MAAIATKTSSKKKRNTKKRPASGNRRRGTKKARGVARKKASKRAATGNGFDLREKAQTFFVDELARLKKLANQFRSTDGLKQTFATLEHRLERLFRFRKQKPSRRRHA
jgi:hypothetical protein